MSSITDAYHNVFGKFPAANGLKVFNFFGTNRNKSASKGDKDVGFWLTLLKTPW
jgi:hypothetical protein